MVYYKFNFLNFKKSEEMAKKKEGARINIKLVSIEGPHKGKSVYVTQKNRNNTKDRLEIKKYCKFTKKHILHREAK